jgi:hypothetical protein
MIQDLEKRKNKAKKRSDTDDLWIKIESLQWVYLFAIKNENMVVISYDLVMCQSTPTSTPKI